MKDQEVKDLIKDLESVGLSEDPSTIEVGRDGVTSITYGSDDNENEIIFLLKRASYEKISLWSNFCYLTLPRATYCIHCKSEEDAKKVAKKIQTFLNS